MNCGDTQANKNYVSFPDDELEEGDVSTFIVDLKHGTLEVIVEDEKMGKIYDIPKYENLVFCASIFYVGDEIELLD